MEDNIISKINKKNLLGYGSGRIVFDLENEMVLKIPYNNMGIQSNKLEVEYFKEKPDIVAKIYKYEKNLIFQEKLYNTITVPYEYTLNGTVEDYLEQLGINVEKDFLNEMLNTRVQIGKDLNGKYKFFDYEDVKLKRIEIIDEFRMSDCWLDDFFRYVQEYGINNIEKWETYEDHRGFLTK